MKLKDILDLDKRKDIITVQIYIVWIIIQINLWGFGYNEYARRNFFPFGNYKWNNFRYMLGYYDMSEFIVYAVVPVLLFIAYKFIRTNKAYRKP